MTSALSGIRVLDLTQVMAGPWCTQILADLGADVIKVEPVVGGDQSRSTMGAPTPTGTSAGFNAVNRNKRGVALDLKTEQGRRLLHQLAGRSDVLVENLRPGVAERLGVDYPTLSAVNPKLVVTSLTGFGVGGPLADRPGYDLVAQAMSGILSVTGTSGGDPVKCGVPVTDLASGLFAAIGTLAALRARDLTGAGDHVRTSLYQAGLSLLVWETAQLWSTGQRPEPTGSAHRMLGPYEALRTRDGWIVVAANNERLWHALCAVLDRGDLPADPRFHANHDRVVHRAELAVELERSLVTDSTDVWVDKCLAAGVPAGPVRSVPEAIADPHSAALDMVGTTTRPGEPPAPALGLPLRMHAPTRWPGRPAPHLGEHTNEILTDLGLDEFEIGILRAEGVVR